jgi:ABC-type transport system involved in cytochrome bd biosynthesis fused ATPase/permease subunit
MIRAVIALLLLAANKTWQIRRSCTALSRAQVGIRRQTGVTLETRHLSRKVGRRGVVDDVSVQVFAGEILAIVGPSGVGKSSFLRLFNRLDEPTSGTILLKSEGYRPIALQDLRRARRHGHADSPSVSRHCLLEHRVQTKAARRSRDRGADRIAPESRRPARICGSRRRLCSGGEAQRAYRREPWRMLPTSCSLMSRPLRWMKALCALSKNSLSASFRNEK